MKGKRILAVLLTIPVIMTGNLNNAFASAFVFSSGDTAVMEGTSVVSEFDDGSVPTENVSIPEESPAEELPDPGIEELLPEELYNDTVPDDASAEKAAEQEPIENGSDSLNAEEFVDMQSEEITAVQDVSEADSDSNSQNWTLDESGTLTISGPIELEHWSSHPYAPWSSPADSKSASIKTVIVQSGVTTIERYSFYGCSNLTNIVLPAGLTDIGEYAFYGCTSLENISIPSSVTSIGFMAFYGCSSLKTIALPYGIEEIAGSTFWRCSSLESISLPQTITSVKSSAFKECSSLQSIALPINVTSVEDSTFEGCDSLESILLPSDITAIGDRAFKDCSCLENVTLPESLLSIGEYAFQCCSSLESIALPDSLTSIGVGIFGNCSSLKDVVLSNSLTTISASTFAGCSSLETISLPSGITSIRGSAFNSCHSLKNITLPDGLTSIGVAAFKFCEALESIMLLENVTSIGDQAFYGCTNLTIYGGGINSAAEKYAYEHNIPFFGLDGTEYDMSGTYSFQNLSDRIPFSLYARYYDLADAWNLHKADNGTGGQCAGMVTSAMATSVYGQPDVSGYSVPGYSVSNLYQVFSPGTQNTISELTASEYIKAAHIYQYSSMFALEYYAHNGDVKGLYTAVKDYSANGASPVFIVIGGTINNKNSSHALYALGIRRESDYVAEVSVYDCNYPFQERILFLFKTDGELSGKWKYQVRDESSDYEKVIWGSGHSNAQITYLTPTRAFLAELSSGNKFNNDYHHYFSTTGQNSRITIGNTTYRLTGNTDANYDDLRFISADGILPDGSVGSRKDVYLAALDGGFTVQSGSDTSVFTISSGESGMEVTVPAYRSADLTMEEGVNSSAKFHLAYGNSFAVTYCNASDDNSTLDIVTVSGTGNGAVNTVQTDDGILIDGASDITITTADENDEIKDTLTVPADSSVLIATNEEQKINVYEDTDNDGTYETNIAGNGHTHAASYRDNGDGTHTKFCPACNTSTGIAETHSWDNGQVTKTATCAAEGIMTYTCSLCGAVRTEALPESDVHTWNNGQITKAATCAAEGIMTYTCSLCGLTKTEAIPKTELHSWQDWITDTEATVFQPEHQTRSCSVCQTAENRSYGNPEKAAISLNAKSLKLKVRQKTNALRVSGLAKGDSVISVKSGNTRILKVSRYTKSGTITLAAQKKTGTAKLTIQLASGLKKTIRVKIQKGTVKTTRISDVAKKITLKKGKKLTLTPVITPITSQQKITYTSSAPKVATVNRRGMITARRAGTATITVKSGSVSVRCKVVVR